MGIGINLGDILGRGDSSASVGGPNIDTEDWGGTIGSLIGTGLSAWKTQLQSDLLSQQIAAKQTPSIVAGPNGTPSAGISYTVAKDGSITYSAGNSAAGALAGASSIFSSSTLLILVFVVIVVLLLKR